MIFRISLVPRFVINYFSFLQIIQSPFSVVVPLIATVGLNNQVTLEKDGTGQVEAKLNLSFAIDSFYDQFPEQYRAYELDLSLVDQFDLA